MRKVILASAAAMMIVAPTVAQAATRPEPTEFTQPVVDESDLGSPVDGDDLTLLFLLGGAALIGLILAMSSSNGNSPT